MNTAESWSESTDGPQAVVQPMAGQCQQPSSAPHTASTQPGTASISNDPADSKAAAEASEAQGLKKQAKSIDLTIKFIQPAAAQRQDGGRAMPFDGISAPAGEGWWESARQPQAQAQLPASASSERAESKILSDEEVEESEAADSFPALGFPATLGSVCSGDFSDDMKRAGAAGDDWSDWDRHLPTSPSSSDVPDSQASSLSRTLSKQTSDKFELAEGEDEELKRVMWVVENLQEELLAADNARMAADEKVQARSIIVQDLQLEVQERVSVLADLGEQITEIHAELEKQLLQQLETQELLRQHEEGIRSTATDTSHVNQVIQEKDEEMAALKEQIAERKHAEQQAAASVGAGASSQSPVKPAADESPHSNMSSPWGTDVSDSEDENDSKETSPAKATPLSQLTSRGQATSSQSPNTNASPREAGGYGTAWLRGVLGSGKKPESAVDSSQKEDT